MVINTPSLGKEPMREGFKIRSLAERYKITCFTSLDTAEPILLASKTLLKEENLSYETLEYYKKSAL